MSRDLKIISLDLDGTLTHSRFIDMVWSEGIPKLYAEKRGLSLEQAKEYVFREYAKVGEGRVEWYDIKYWFQFLGLGEDWAGLLKGFEQEIKPYPEVLPVLARLSQRYELVLLTNAVREFVGIQVERAGIKGYVARILSSTSDLGEVKKTAEVYSKVCQLLQIEPEELAHIGDHYLFDFVVPRKLGICAFYLDREEEREGDFIVHNLSEFEAKIEALA